MNDKTNHSSDHVQVFCRIRPLSLSDKFSDGILTYMPTGYGNGPYVLQVAEKSLAFTVDKVFSSPEITQESLYDKSIKAFVVGDFFQGIHGTCFSYGQTGSGKTHTLIGDVSSIDSEQRGLLPRTVEDILQNINEQMTVKAEKYHACLKVSILEIYHEKLCDLLSPVNSVNTFNKLQNLSIREQSDGTIYVENLSDSLIKSSSDFIKLLTTAIKRRKVGSHKMNDQSSRSHLCCMLTLVQHDLEQHLEIKSNLSLIDLAGSEMAKKTEASGQRLNEAKFINKSLSALSNVISALSSGGNGSGSINSLNVSSSLQSLPQHIPFRDSKLTRLLQNSLGGNSKVVIILAVSASPSHISETISTLKFGERARLIQTAPLVNKHMIGSSTSKEEELLKKQVQQLKQQVGLLQKTIRSMQRNQISNDNDKEFALEQSSPTTTDNVRVSPYKTPRKSNDDGQGICEVCKGVLSQISSSAVPAFLPAALETNSLRQVKPPATPQARNAQDISVTGEAVHMSKQDAKSINENRLDDATDNGGRGKEAEEDVKEEDDEYYDDVENCERCAICGLNEEETDKLNLDTGEYLGSLFSCDGNCGDKFHVRCVGLIGEGGQYTMPEGEWFCTQCQFLSLTAECTSTSASLEENVIIETTTEESMTTSAHDENNVNSSVDGTNETAAKEKKERRVKEDSHGGFDYEYRIALLQEKFDTMRRERNLVLQHWQHEKQLQQGLESRREAHEQAVTLELTKLQDDLGEAQDEQQRLQEENTFLKTCLADLKEALANEKKNNHLNNSLSLHASVAGESWQNLSRSQEMMEFMTDGMFWGKRTTSQQEEDDDFAPPQASTQGSSQKHRKRQDQEEEEEQDISPVKQALAGANKHLASSYSSRAEAFSTESSIPKPWLKSRSTSEPIEASADLAALARHQSLPSNYTDDRSNSPPSHKFLNPLRNRLTDLLALVREETDSYAEIKSRHKLSSDSAISRR